MNQFKKRWARRIFPAKSFAYSSRNSLFSRLHKRSITAYWYPENNFGDQLTPQILRHYGLLPLFSPAIEKCELVSTGSILELVPVEYSGYIVGSGFLMPSTDRIFPKARILSVRGRHTALKLALPESTRLGDPGILVDSIYRRMISGISKKYKIGIVPHYQDFCIPALSQLVRRFPEDICLIDVRQKPGRVVGEIAACRNILSSSLHGIVTAHSLGIPASPLRLSDKVKGLGFKFEDYYSAYDLEPSFFNLDGNESIKELSQLPTRIEPGKTAFVKNEVHSAFEELASRFK